MTTVLKFMFAFAVSTTLIVPVVFAQEARTQTRTAECCASDIERVLNAALIEQFPFAYQLL
nr:hypothetical protein [uncultured Undibacterium sp.]